MITINIDISDHFQEFNDEFEAALARALERVGQKCEEYAQDLCPVDTGNLRTNITHTVENNRNMIVGSNVEYARYAETETGMHLYCFYPLFLGKQGYCLRLLFPWLSCYNRVDFCKKRVIQIMVLSEVLTDFFYSLTLGVMLLALPYGTGCLFFPKGERDKGLIYLLGMLTLMALFEVLYLPFFFLKQSFSLLTVAFFLLAVSAAVGGFLLVYRRGPLPAAAPGAALTRSEKLCAAGFLAVFLLQTVRLTAGAGTWNIDDAWYLAIANDAVHFDSIMTIDPVTGFSYDYTENLGSNLEYVFSPWPLFWAAFSRLFAFPVTMLMRTILPFYFLVAFYFVAYRLALFLFAGKRESALFALFLLSIFYELSAVAMNVRYTWIICYPWMGKGFGPSVICPAALLLFLLCQEEADTRRRRILWLGVFLANLAGCMAASSCAELNLIALGCWGLVAVIRKRDWSLIWKLALCVSPSFALMGAHFI